MTLGPNASPTVAPSVVKMPLREASDGVVPCISSSPRNQCVVHSRCRRSLFERSPRRASAATSLRQSEHVELIAEPGLQLGRQAHETERQPGATRADGDVLLA